MSQTIFPVSEKVECQVGWDTMLGTFYGRVYRVEDEEELLETDEEEADGNIHWVGTTPCEIRTVDLLEERLKPHVESLPDGVRRDLRIIEVD